MNINQRKKILINRYGLEQTVGYYYYLWNPIAYVGEKWVRESFESVQGLGDEPVIIGDYSSDDGTPELAREYGFKVITVPKVEGVMFHEPKVENAVIHNAKSNFLIDLSIHYNYPKKMDSFCRDWLRKNINQIDKKILIIRGKYFNADGSFGRYACGSWMTYRPYWLAVRGFDERGEYPWGAGPYGTGILRRIWKLKIDEHYIGMEHKIHRDLKHSYWREKFGIPNKEYHPMAGRMKCRALLDNIAQNFDKGVREVHNSYW